jgi:uncharacterized protein YbjQ (UPF0145 family)
VTAVLGSGGSRLTDALFFFYVVLPLASFIVTSLITFITGRVIARRWDADLDRRERALSSLTVTTCRWAAGGSVETVGLCVGCCVGAIDRWRRFTGSVRMMFGGELEGWTPILARARRAAMVRMLERAHGLGATDVVNVRLETSSLRSVESGSKGVSPVEFVAYGTALVRRF